MTARTKEIIDEVASLPVEERIAVVESLLQGLNPADPEADRLWAGVAQRRLQELREGKVRGVSMEEVVAKVNARLSR